ncbi:tryptophan halogenase [Sphingopyxis sp. H050]|jgi:tryptophan halogenase|uniref:tryptophan halogenase family protein n=1 Tax=Sphingopyxis sp. H050 TaxID=1759072 RepID=UPI000736BD79|nr:tryptophan halogenase family protein [Sphingopyxis sp. H050]KTE22538.1 tryptophan halogenase [Sphingopyxis sp. H050]
MRLIIIGGGTAGWMAAACLRRFLPRQWSVRLVESDAIGTVGVGEATIPQIRLFNEALGIDEEAFLAATRGTIKLGIEFADWGGRGERYMHAFGAVGRGLGLLEFHHYWLRGRAAGIAAPLGAYSLNEQAARALRMQRGAPRTSPHLLEMPYAYHFDAGLYAAFLRRRAEASGVERIEGKIADVKLDGGSGDVTGVTLDDGRTLDGDFFIDCSGFRGLLIEEALGTGYDDWSHWLINDRAIAVPCAHGAVAQQPWTTATARDAGWQWRIPLQHRIGNGYVYSSAHLSDEDALATLLAGLDGPSQAEPNRLRFTSGKRRRMWNRNVVALGLAAGFMEPLESTSIHLVQSGISRLIKLLPAGNCDPAVAAEFNRQSDFEWERIRDFIILHFHATARRDTPYWRDRAAMDLPDTLAAKLELYRAQGLIVREHEELFTESGWLQVLAGQGVEARRWHPLADSIDPADLGQFLAAQLLLIEREVAQMQSYDRFLSAVRPEGVTA